MSAIDDLKTLLLRAPEDITVAGHRLLRQIETELAQREALTDQYMNAAIQAKSEAYQKALDKALADAAALEAVSASAEEG